MADEPTRFPNNGNQETTQESQYITYIMLRINDINKLPEGIFPVKLKIINQYQQKYPSLIAKYKTGKYESGSFCGVRNINFNNITCEDKIVIPLILQN